MGTRGLIVVYDEQGTPKIAQYFQYDGYPSGQGKDVLAFLQDQQAVYMFRTYRLKNCRFLSQNEIDKINKEKNPIEQRPQLSRNMGADILRLAATVDSLALVNSLDFAADGLFCEWAYVISFQDNTLEVYKGFNQDPKKLDGRFKDMTPENGEYTPVTLIKTYKLDALPTLDQLIADCDPPEDE